MTVYGGSATRDRQGWFFGLTGPQVFLVLAAAFPSWLAMAVGEWAALLALVPLWLVAVALICVPVRGWSAAQWIGVLARHVWVARPAGPGGSRKGPRVRSETRPRPTSPVCWLESRSTTGRRWRDEAFGQPSSRTMPPGHGRLRLVSLHPGIGMADDADRDRMGAGLSELLEAASASSQIDVLAIWFAPSPTTAPSEPSGCASTPARRSPSSRPTSMHNSTRRSAGAAVRTEAFVTVVVREDAIAKDARRAGSRCQRPSPHPLRHPWRGGSPSHRCHRLHAASPGSHSATWPSRSAPVSNRGTPQLWPTPSSNTGTTPRSHGRRPSRCGRSAPMRRPRCGSYRHGEWAVHRRHDPAATQGRRDGRSCPSPRSVPGRRAPCPDRVLPTRSAKASPSAAPGAPRCRPRWRPRFAARSAASNEPSDRHAVEQVHETDEKLERDARSSGSPSALAVTVPAAWNTQDYGRRLDASVRLCGFTPLPLDGAHDAAFAAAVIPLGTGLPNRRGTRDRVMSGR